MARLIDKKSMHDKHQLRARAAAQLVDIIRRHATFITLLITTEIMRIITITRQFVIIAGMARTTPGDVCYC